MTFPRTLLFVDTMLFLHFKSIDQVDWKGLMKGSGIDTDGLHIVIARVTTRELDKHKNTHKSQTIRERAGKALKQIERWREDTKEAALPTLRGDIPVIVSAFYDVVDFEAYRLQRASADDELIAAMLSHREKSPGIRLVLVSDDSGPRMTAASLGMWVVRPDEGDRLEPEQDPKVKENAELKKEIATLRHKEPRLSLALDCPGLAEPSGRLHVKVPSVPPEPLREWEDALRRANDSIPVILSPDDDMRAGAERNLDSGDETVEADLEPMVNSTLKGMFSQSIPREEFERYARERQGALDAFAASLRENWQRGNERQRGFFLNLLVCNDGSVPADDVDVSLHIPDGPEAERVSMSEQEHLEQLDPLGEPPFIPSLPRPPARPRTAVQLALSGVNTNFTMPPSLHQPMSANITRVGGMVLRRTNSFDATEHFERIKHGYSYKLETLRLWFPLSVTPKSFSITYRITAANLAVPAEGVLHVILNADA